MRRAAPIQSAAIEASWFVKKKKKNMYRKLAPDTVRLQSLGQTQTQMMRKSGR